MHTQQLYSQQQTIPPAIRSVSEDELAEERRKEELTVFHTMEVWEPTGDDARNTTVRQDGAVERSSSPKPRTGSLRWGPDLESFLVALLSSIGLNGEASSGGKQTSPMGDETQIILALTMLYADRSTSFDAPLHVDPQTGQPWCPPCPHLLPRTVHRMLLTSMIIATKCVRGDTSTSNVLREAANAMLGEKYAISDAELEQMENWMLHALGSGVAGSHHSHPHHDISWQVSHDEVGAFLRKWGATFYPRRLAAHDESRMKDIEKFWRDQTAVFGTSHGHGNYGSGAYHGAAPLHYSSMEHPESHPEAAHGHHPEHHYYQPPISDQ